MLVAGKRRGRKGARGGKGESVRWVPKVMQNAMVRGLEGRLVWQGVRIW